MKIDSLNLNPINTALNQAFLNNNLEFDKVLKSLEQDQATTDQAISNASNLANADSKLFATFDFMQAMNQLLYGNPSESQRAKLMTKMQNIAKSI